MEFIFQLLSELFPRVEEEIVTSREAVNASETTVNKAIQMEMVDNDEQEETNLFGVMEFH